MPLYVPEPNLTPFGTHDCRLEWNSATTIRLVRYGGSTIMIGGVRRVIPAGGVIFTTPATDANLYVFATWTGTAITLSTSAATDALVTDAYGMPVHSANPGATLVGLIWAQSTGIDGPRLVCSYWNRVWRSDDAKAGSFASASNTPAIVNGLTVYFVGFAGDAWDSHVTGVCYTSTTVNAILGVETRLDAVSGNTWESKGTAPAVNTYVPISVRIGGNLVSTGLHSIAPYVWQNAGSGGTWIMNHYLRRQA
jgi:hypothetical protein